MKRPIVLLILDGWGHSNQQLGNAIATAKTPTLDFIKYNYPGISLQASGKAVGLPWGESGNSEVGHITLGAGRTTFQYPVHISRAISNGTFFKNTAFERATEHIKTSGGSLHIAGLLGSGTVHSSFEHLMALVEFAQRTNVKKTYLHLFTDGKDSGLQEAPELFNKLKRKLEQYKTANIATVIGRSYAMDRAMNWKYTQKAYDLLAKGEGAQTTDVVEELYRQYENGINDPLIEPIVLNPEGILKNGDAIIFFNFREDSMRQITRAFTDTGFQFFPVKKLNNLLAVFMTQYMERSNTEVSVAFPVPEIQFSLSEMISSTGRKQLHIAETEKYAHVTYFFNGLRNKPFTGEKDTIIKSHKTLNEHPEMRVNEIMALLKKEFLENIHDFYVVNVANADMLAHTGNLGLTIAGIEHVDKALRSIYETIIKHDGILLVTADHGNAESLVYKETGNVETKHNPNPVPFFLVANEVRRFRTDMELLNKFRTPQGIISDVAPTILQLMEIEKPEEMTGESLLDVL